MASEQDVKDALTSVVASIESLLADIRTQLNTVKSELLDYMSPKTVQTTLF